MAKYHRHQHHLGNCGLHYRALIRVEDLYDWKYPGELSSTTRFTLGVGSCTTSLTLRISPVPLQTPWIIVCTTGLTWTITRRSIPLIFIWRGVASISIRSGWTNIFILRNVVYTSSFYHEISIPPHTQPWSWWTPICCNTPNSANQQFSNECVGSKKNMQMYRTWGSPGPEMGTCEHQHHADQLASS